MDFPRDSLATALQMLANQGIYLGTSSWKYPGWLDLLYTRSRYYTRGKISQAKFEATCLAEYAEVFKTVCFDGALYRFPSSKLMENYMAQVPSDFRMSMKVTEDITVRKFHNIPRNIRRVGQVNESFLDADVFQQKFLAPLEPYQGKIGTLIFEFSTFKDEWAQGAQFIEALDNFLDCLPPGWNYAVEVRNRNFLVPDYFAVLRRRGVCHTFNNWSDMPSVGEQIQMSGSFTANFTTARFLLKPGRSYNEAVDSFSPYSQIKEPNLEARTALIDLLLPPSKPGRPTKRFVYVNNRLEGCALWTIYATITGLLGKTMPETTMPPPFRLE